METCEFDPIKDNELREEIINQITTKI